MGAKIDSFGDCLNKIKGTGKAPCEPKSYGDLVGEVLFDKGTKFAITNNEVALDETIYTTLLQDREAHPLIKRMNFSQDTPDNEVYTDPTGLESSIRDGKPKFTFMFAQGGNFHKALSSLDGDDRWDAGLIFSKGLLLTASVDETYAKGFDGGRFNVPTIKFLQGTDPQQSSAIMQFTDPDEFNDRHIFLTWAELGFDMSKVDGVIDVRLTVVTPPTIGGTTFSVDAVYEGNKSTKVLGLGVTAKWAIGGIQAGGTKTLTVSYNTSTKLYDFEANSAFADGDTIAPRLVDGSKNVAKDDNDKLYAGEAKLYTLVTGAPVITSDGAAAAVVGTPFTYAITGTNTPTSYAVVGTLPPGLTHSAGTISGTPTGAANVKHVIIQAINASGTGDKILVITVTV